MVPPVDRTLFKPPQSKGVYSLYTGSFKIKPGWYYLDNELLQMGSQLDLICAPEIKEICYESVESLPATNVLRLG